MKSHFFAVGEAVIYSGQGLSGGMCCSEYEVRDLLDDDDQSPHYQLVCADQSHHRIVGEHEIRAVTAADVMVLPASLPLERALSLRRQRPMLTDPALLET